MPRNPSSACKRRDRAEGLRPSSLAAALAEPLQAICAKHDVAFIVNDSVALAKRLKADGVHLGQGDGDVREARETLGKDAQIGVTCHNSRHLAMEAAEAGADYVAFGAFFPTTTKEVDHVAELGGCVSNRHRLRFLLLAFVLCVDRVEDRTLVVHQPKCESVELDRIHRRCRLFERDAVEAPDRRVPDHFGEWESRLVVLLVE